MQRLKDKNTIILALVWTLLAVIYWGVYQQDILYSIHSGSFYTEAVPFVERVVQEDGWAMLVARYFTQFFIAPLSASIVVAVVLCLCSLGLGLLLNIRQKDMVWAFVPSSLILLIPSVAGYNIHIPIRDLLVMPTLGYVCVLLFVALYNRVFGENKVSDIIEARGFAGMAGVASYPIVGYLLIWFIGIYGVVAMLTLTAVLWKKNDSSRVTILVLSLVPIILSHFFVFDTRYFLSPFDHYIYTGIFVAELLASLSPMAIALVKSYADLGERWESLKWRNWIGLAVVSLTVFLCTERNSGFRGECRLFRDMMNLDFDALVKDANEIEEPNWACFSFRLIGLEQKGQIENRLFDYNCYRGEYISNSKFYYPWLYLYAGQPLISLSYAMDYHLMKEENYGNMQVMVIDYVMIGEKEAAEKLLNQLDDNIVYRDWADNVRKHYGTIADFCKHNPPYGKAIRGAFSNNIVVAQMPFEEFLYANYAATETNIRRRILCSLFMKNIEDFKMLMNMYGRSFGPVLPVAHQEAICLLAAQGDESLLTKFPVSKNIGERVNNILKCVKQKEGYKEIREKFGDSYLTYYFFAVKPERKEEE